MGKTSQPEKAKKTCEINCTDINFLQVCEFETPEKDQESLRLDFLARKDL